jgi:aminobenzoyl-glutamate utilization protein B
MSIGHKSLVFASKVMAGTAVELVTKPDLLKEIKDEHSERMTGKKYVCPIPKDVKPPLEIARKAAGLEE